MKKLLMTLALFLAVAFPMGAQTYCYKYLFSIDEDGVRFTDELFAAIPYSYYTFVNNKSNFYSSDKNGIYAAPYGEKCKYQGYEDGIYIYKNQYNPVWYYFSSDYSRMNCKYKSMTKHVWQTNVYEKSVEPSKKHAPAQLY